MVRTFRAESTQNKWEVTYSGIWTRYKKEYICMKANASNVRLRCIEYQGTPYQQLSARQKSNADDKIVEINGKIRKNILEEQSRTVKTDYGIKPNYKFIEYPNTEIRSRYERLDGYFLVLGLHEYVNEAKFHEIYEKGIK